MSGNSLCFCCEIETPFLKSAEHKNEQSDPPLVITTSDFNVSVKEIFILCLFLLLLFYSFVSFLKNWNKNYRDINHFPQFSEEDSQFIESGLKKYEKMNSIPISTYLRIITSFTLDRGGNSQ